MRKHKTIMPQEFCSCLMAFQEFFLLRHSIFCSITESHSASTPCKNILFIILYFSLIKGKTSLSLFHSLLRYIYTFDYALGLGEVLILYVYILSRLDSSSFRASRTVSLSSWATSGFSHHHYNSPVTSSYNFTLE